jgi:hypothetical protein
MANLNLEDVQLFSILKGESLEISLDEITVWKIESAGIGGSNGTLFLNDHSLADDQEPIAMLYTSVNEHNFGSPVPFWLKPTFNGSILNDSSFSASVSVTIYTIEEPEILPIDPPPIDPPPGPGI